MTIHYSNNELFKLHISKSFSQSVNNFFLNVIQSNFPKKIPLLSSLFSLFQLHLSQRGNSGWRAEIQQSLCAFTQHYQRKNIYSSLVLAILHLWPHSIAFSLQTLYYYDAIFAVSNKCSYQFFVQKCHFLYKMQCNFDAT